MNKETEKANDAEECSAILLDKVSVQEKLLMSSEEKMNAMTEKMAQLASSQSGQNISAHFTSYCASLKR